MALLPEPIIIDPPADLVEQRAYFEPLEGMRVAIGRPDSRDGSNA